MEWLTKIFGNDTKKPNSAQQACDRLKVVVAYQRNEGSGYPADYLPRLREELLLVVRKYVTVSDDDVQVNIKREEGLDVLAMDIVMPDIHKRV
jgi:cell division topological specificity factor